MNDADFRERVLSDLARLERKTDDTANQLTHLIERMVRVEERVAVRAALIGALVVLAGWMARVVVVK
jgi:hypothetical protein